MLKRIREIILPKKPKLSKYDVLNKDLQRLLTPQDTLTLLIKGNQRFVEGVSLNRDYNYQVESTSKGQYPHSIILSCIDSRVPTEIVFDQGIGDLFNARIAGNFVNEDILGSVEFACAVAGAKLIVVMGHTSCGAIKGACDDVKLGNLTSLLSNLKEAVDSTPSVGTGSRKSDNELFVDKVAERNVVITAKRIVDKSPVIKDLVDQGKVLIVGAMYDVASGKVNFL